MLSAVRVKVDEISCSWGGAQILDSKGSFASFPYSWVLLYASSFMVARLGSVSSCRPLLTHITTRREQDDKRDAFIYKYSDISSTSSFQRVMANCVSQAGMVGFHVVVIEHLRHRHADRAMWVHLPGFAWKAFVKDFQNNVADDG